MNAPDRPLSLPSALSVSNVDPWRALGVVTAAGALAAVWVHGFLASPTTTRTAHAAACSLAGLASLVALLVGPGWVSGQIVRDRSSGAVHLAREVEPSASRRFFAYWAAPQHLAWSIVVTAFVAMAPSGVAQGVSAATWFGVGALVLAGVAASSLVAAVVAFALPRQSLTLQSQGIGVAAPLGLGVLLALTLSATRSSSAPAAALLLALGVASLWPVGVALVDRPDRAFHARQGLVGTLACGLGVSALAMVGPAHRGGPSPAMSVLWAVGMSVAAAWWVFPRQGMLAMAVRQGTGNHAARALGVALGASLAFAALRLTLGDASPSGLGLSALTVMLSVTLTAACVAVRASSPARRGAAAMGAAAAGVALAVLESMRFASEPTSLSALDPFQAVVAPTSLPAVAVALAVTAVASALSLAAWRGAERRLAL